MTAVIETPVVPVAAGPGRRTRVLRRLRSEWRAVTRRDFFPPPEREDAVRALRALGEAAATEQVTP